MDTNSVIVYTDKYNHQSHRSHGHKVSQSVDTKLHGLWTHIQYENNRTYFVANMVINRQNCPLAAILNFQFSPNSFPDILSPIPTPMPNIKRIHQHFVVLKQKWQKSFFQVFSKSQKLYIIFNFKFVDVIFLCTLAIDNCIHILLNTSVHVCYF